MYINTASGVSRISFFFGGGGHGAFARGVLGTCSPKKNVKNGAVWCVLESILLKFCQKNL